MVQIGDIVSRNGTRFVVAELKGNASGGQDARLVTKNSRAPYGRSTALTLDASHLEAVESPVFAFGERVRIDGDDGTVQSMSDDHVLVLMDERERPLRGGGKVTVEAAVTRIAVWQLVVENRL